MQRVIKLFQQIGLFFGLVYLNMKRFALSFDMLSRSSVFNGTFTFTFMHLADAFIQSD